MLFVFYEECYDEFDNWEVYGNLESCVVII